MDINKGLNKCSAMRGCYPLTHRSLWEFNWFVDMLIFHRDKLVYEKVSRKLIKKWRSSYDYDKDNYLEDMMDCFVEYCRIIYKR